MADGTFLLLRWFTLLFARNFRHPGMHGRQPWLGPAQLRMTEASPKHGTGGGAGCCIAWDSLGTPIRDHMR